jgi:hypothetical protein
MKLYKNQQILFQDKVTRFKFLFPWKHASLSLIYYNSLYFDFIKIN